MGITPIANSSGSVQSAIAFASARTGIDFNYLLGQAHVESGLRPDAKAGTSSARGLYQFIEQSWLAVVKKHGAEHGLGWAADTITTNANGRLTVSDPAARQSILSLRNDPTTASLMAAEHAADNKVSIEGTLGRAATGTDLYLAHFLGLGGARSFLTKLQANPDQSGAALFPAAAHANRNVFFQPDGQARSLSDIYQQFTAKLDKGAGNASGAASFGAARFANDVQNALGSGVEVIAGSGETQRGAAQWAQATLNQLGGNASGFGSAAGFGGARDAQTLLRPTPATARLAYIMLASLGA